jgi:two-component sensor histidine kinase
MHRSRSKKKAEIISEFERVLRQQEALAAFGKYAFREEKLDAILTEAARLCAGGAGVKFCKVLRYRAEENDLLIESGFGWHEDVVGIHIAQADKSSPAGRAFVTAEPVITRDLSKPHDFTLPPIYAEHGIVSAVNVVIHSMGEAPYGVLEVDSDERREFDRHDINFLQGFGNVLAEAVATQIRLERLRGLLAEREAAVAEKEMLSRELQHRVRNNLQLIAQLLIEQAIQAGDDEVKRGFQAVARRVVTLGQIYNHLLGAGMDQTTDAGAYLGSLCDAITEFHREGNGNVKLGCSIEPLTIDLERTTALGLIVNELVANAFEHAFGQEGGAIEVALRREGSRGAQLIVADNGVGLQENPKSKRLGVTLVRRLVEQIGGSIDLKVDHGTRWVISFPT